jgi:hypothetical protein
MNVKHKTPSGIRQTITTPNGGKAFLIVSGRTAHIDQYKPSKEYFDHVMGKVTKIHISQLGKHQERMSMVRKRTHLQLINKHLGPLFDYLTNPDADDGWMNSTPARQFALHIRRPQHV